ncbi:hypothetical protein AB8Z38_35115 [Bradyrhizobium sp. LLZ17]|uniref:Transposase n=1 Tax=Bradyrhizobium sp. LLZ17 TaxID=3239388 RepID=A0AB39XLE4_9BRAD
MFDADPHEYSSGPATRAYAARRLWRAMNGLHFQFVIARLRTNALIDRYKQS